jgi:DNA polymerase I-like protein with 3'-5' exonuclease and polymerase domains
MKETNPIFIEVDLRQAEWVVMAYCSQDSRMLEVVEEGLDPHTRTGELISRAPTELVLAESKLVGHETDPDQLNLLRRPLKDDWDLGKYFLPRTASIRQAGKKSNHGLNYGLQYKNFALHNELLESDSKKIVTAYHNAYPGIHNYHKWVSEQLKKGRVLYTCFGEKYITHDQLTLETLMSAYSFQPQATVGRVTNIGLRRLFDAKDPPLRRIEPLANVHDSILNQGTFNNCKEFDICLSSIDRNMEVELEYHGRKFMLQREFKVGRDWGHMIEVDILSDESVEAAWDVCQSAA